MRILAALAGFLFVTEIALSATIYVPDNHPTIQGAIDAAANGDTIIVRPGTYMEIIEFGGKAIIVRSEQGAAVTTIDAINAYYCAVTFENGEDSESQLDGFTLTNGRGHPSSTNSYGGGIYCGSSTSPAIKNNIIIGNRVHNLGGGIYCGPFSSPSITNNTISQNEALADGGGIYCSTSSTPLIANNTITGNTVDAGDYGGGIYCDSSSAATITGNTITENLADICGGGIYSRGTGSIISYNLISGNKAGNSGGGIYCFHSSPTIAYNRIEGNTSGEGGGIGCGSSSSPVIVGNNVSGNSATQSGGGMNCSLSSTPTITNNIISGNTAWSGGGINCSSTSPIAITNNIISGNTASGDGGGICCRSSIPDLTNNTITGNSAAFGGGIWCAGSSTPATNTILWNNNAPTGPEIFGSSPVVSYCDVKGGWPGSGNIDADPLFADPANDDFHLTWNSPCRGVGDDSAVTELHDFEGDPRIALGTVDMGADEYYYHLYHTGDVIPGGSIEIKVVGYPSAPVTLAIGMAILDPPLPTQHGNLHIWPFAWSGIIGNIPGSGIHSMTITVSPGWNPGDKVPLQALVGPWGGPYTRLSNLLTLTVE